MTKKIDKKKSDTVRYSSEQIAAMIARGDDRTDWPKAMAMTGRKLEASIAKDPDDVADEVDWTRAVIGIPAPKDHINIRIDHDVLEWFKAGGRGYQTAMNNVLRAFMESRQRVAAEPLNSRAGLRPGCTETGLPEDPGYRGV